MYTAKDGSQIFVLRPQAPSRTLKQEYRTTENFQIFLRKPGLREFRPNHLRLLIDLYLKKVSDPQKADLIFSAIEQVHQGDDPEDFVDDIKGLTFKMQIDNADINVYCAQLFMLEQDINWAGKSRFDPPRSLLLGYIRWVRSGEEEIDKIVWSAAPPKRYYIFPPSKFVRPK